MLPEGRDPKCWRRGQSVGESSASTCSSSLPELAVYPATGDEEQEKKE